MMEWTHFACMAAGGLLGSFLMTVWRNQRRHRREQEALRLAAMHRNARQ